MSTNIGRDNTDASYRYKMPVMQTKIEGRGNGIKTVVTNMREIATALHIHPAYTTKYLGIEVGAQSKYTASDERAVVNGSFMTSDFAKILEKFIDTFILCPKCKLPELKMIVKSSIKIDCAACGYNGELKTSHKLAQYIIKNPPSSLKEGRDHKKDKERKKAILDAAAAEEAGEESFEEKEKKRRVHKRDKKRMEREAASPQNDTDQHEADEISPDRGCDSETSAESPEVKKEKKKKEKKDKKEKKEKKGKKEKEEEEEEQWHTDTSKEAQKARQEAEFKERKEAAANAAADLVQLSISCESANSAVIVLRQFINSQQRTAQEVDAELRRIAVSRELDERGKYKVLVETLLHPAESAKTVVNRINDNRKYFQFYCRDRMGQMLLLNCIEELCGVTDTRLLPLTGHILKALYEADICVEESIIEWFNAPLEASLTADKEAVQKVKAKARIFVGWLQEADEEESCED